MNIEPGTYQARAISGALGCADNGTEQIAVAMEITSDCQSRGEQVTWYGYFTDKTAERTLKVLRKMGWSTDDLTDLTGIDANEVQLRIKEEEYQGKMQMKVDIFANDGPVLKNQMSPEQARAFAARMKGAAVVSRGRNVNAPPVAKSAAKAGPSNGRATNQTPPDDYDDSNAF